MLESQKHLFALPEDVTYLDAAYMSPIPKTAATAGYRGVDVKTSPWDMTIDSYYDEVESARSLAASFIGARPEDVAVIPATSYGIAVAAANVPVAAGSVIVMMENEHTSNRYAWYELAAKKGAEILTVPRAEHETWGAALTSAILGSDKPVSVVVGSMVHWFEGMSVDLEQVSDATHSVGANLVLDGTQWVGAIPFDVKRIRPDFLSFATYKFLLGPYRLAFLYAGEAWHKSGKPIEFHSWNRSGGERPDFYLETMPDYLPGARRFDMGERSDFAVLPIAIEAMSLLKNWGQGAVNERLLHLNQLIWRHAESRGFDGPPASMRAGHIAVIELGARNRPDLAGLLRQKNVHVTIRGNKMRVTPHVYNDESDIERLFETLDQVKSN